ncbi:M23 family metallopeptidase [Bartonella sp. HY329]|uniref:peptidoglycan DD-metalloendopeptidase family protein n=1 Tax=unclassified Bartonella TaxID=2645622 RepID=UPI0021CA7B07|nr:MULTISPECIES: M23 family metallopeptidase [unclassified Bartonella]UXM96265.1 M23 family metallopeptidase [Bartonella sp. HY329]UXN10589.1 M23 family metallopeptidase [Bartonella sp. HY328]
MHLKIIDKVSRRYIQGAALIVITGLVAGCSSDTMRFTDGLFTNSTPSQQAAVNRPIPQQQPQPQQLPPPVQSGTIQSNALPPAQPQYQAAQQPQYQAPQQPQYQAQTPQYPQQPTHQLAPGQVAGTGEPPRNLGTLPASAVQGGHASSSVGNRSYIVQSGDTLTRVANRNGVSVNDIKNANGLSSGAIRVGQNLIIPGRGSAGQGTAVAAANPPVTPVSVPRTQAVGQTAAVKPNIPAAQTTTGNQNTAQNTNQGNVIETVAVRMEQPTTAPQKVAPAQQATPQQPAAQAQNAVASKNDSIAQAEQVAAVAPQATGISQMRWPARGRILSSFGQLEGTVTNDGLDIMVPEGTSIRAAENGVVIYAGDGLKEFGNTVLIRHENNIVTVYGHNSKILVKRNQQVRRGDEIAKSGMSGNASTPKLHFEVRKNSVPVNPVKFLEN